MHPLLHLVATQPQALVEHGEAYAELLAAEASSAASAWKREAAFGAAALCCGATGVMLGGVAVLLWATLPAAQMPAAWALWVVPLLPLVGGVACVIALRNNQAGKPFAQLIYQFKADLKMLREAAPP